MSNGKCHIVMLAAVWLLLAGVRPSHAYIETPHSLGKVIADSTTIVVMKVEKVDREKNLIYYKKVRVLKGKHPGDAINHRIAKAGFHEREWKTVMAEATAGKTAVFFSSGDSSVTCLGTYWYFCLPQDGWYNMWNGQPFLLRSFCGNSDRLAAALTEMLAGREVIVPCLRDGSKEDLHVRKGKLQRVRASLKLLDYDPKRDFVGWAESAEDQASKNRRK
jgi:hypothetical protein